MGRELAQRKRTYPEVWRLGENLADDRFDIRPSPPSVLHVAPRSSRNCEYIRTGAAADDTAAIARFRDDYDRGRQMAERSFFPEPETWLAMSPLIANGVELHIDETGLAMVFAFKATTPPFEQAGVAKGGYLARLAELIRH